MTTRQLVALTLILTLALLALVLVLLAGVAGVRAAPTAELHVCPSGCTYSSIQAAVDAAGPSDIIKVAQGTYTDVRHIAALDTATFTATQMVAITKSVTIQGGYTTTNWTTSDPEAHPTTLDAQGKGRVIYITGDISPTIEGLRITGGAAAGLGGNPWGVGGGGVYIITATATLSNVSVFSNTARYGGGLYLAHSDAQVINSVIKNNGETGGAGGGAYLYHSDGVLLAGNCVTANRAGNGGGLFLFWSDATLERNTIVSNTARYEAGGVRLGTSNAILRGNVIAANEAGYGGGLSLFSYGHQPIFEENRIISNTATWRAGGIYFNYFTPAVMINTVIADNRAPEGGGLYIRSSSPRLLHTTIVRNAGGSGVGVYISDSGGIRHSNVAMTNTIIFSHTVGITVTAGNTATLNATLWHANGTDRAGAGVINHTNDHTGDPAFAADGYHLTDGSAAVDRGVDAGVTWDIDGDARPRDGGYDLGADELPPWTVYLPLVMRE